MGLIKDRADAAAREKAAAMPPPASTARRGITACRYMGLTEHQAALAVMVAVRAAVTSVLMDGCEDVTWLEAIHAEASRIYDRSTPHEADSA